MELFDKIAQATRPNKLISLTHDEALIIEALIEWELLDSQSNWTKQELQSIYDKIQ